MCLSIFHLYVNSMGIHTEVGRLFIDGHVILFAEGRCWGGLVDYAGEKLNKKKNNPTPKHKTRNKRWFTRRQQPSTTYLNNHAAESPAMPLPMTAMLFFGVVESDMSGLATGGIGRLLAFCFDSMVQHSCFFGWNSISMYGFFSNYL